MVNKQQKLWASYETVRNILGIYITLFFAVPALAICFGLLSHQTAIDARVEGAVKIAVLSGLKWYAIIMPIITVLFVIWFLFRSDRVVFTETSINYYKWIFSKHFRNISYDTITECVFKDGLRKHKGIYEHGRKIVIYNKEKIILELELYYKLCFMLVSVLIEAKIRVISNNLNLQTLDKHYNIDFNSLSDEQKLQILKHYCKLMKSSKKDLKKIFT